MEYLYWCEDMNLAPVLDVWAGFALESGGNTPFTGDALQPYIDDVLNELEVGVPLVLKRSSRPELTTSSSSWATPAPPTAPSEHPMAEQTPST